MILHAAMAFFAIGGFYGRIFAHGPEIVVNKQRE